MAETFLRKDEPFKVARVAVGKGPGMAVSTYAFPASEIGIPTVGFGNHLDDLLGYMKPKTAREVAAALIRAADVAEGTPKITPDQAQFVRTVDRARTTALASSIAMALRDHIKTRHPDRVLEALNALATMVAMLLAVTGNSPLARQFFDEAVRNNFTGLASSDVRDG